MLHGTLRECRGGERSECDGRQEESIRRIDQGTVGAEARKRQQADKRRQAPRHHERRRCGQHVGNAPIGGEQHRHGKGHAHEEQTARARRMEVVRPVYRRHVEPAEHLKPIRPLARTPRRCSPVARESRHARRDDGGRGRQHERKHAEVEQRIRKVGNEHECRACPYRAKRREQRFRAHALHPRHGHHVRRRAQNDARDGLDDRRMHQARHAGGCGRIARPVTRAGQRAGLAPYRIDGRLYQADEKKRQRGRHGGKRQGPASAQACTAYEPNG